MKKIVFATVSALALAAVAVDSTQFGVMRVPSNAKETIVAVPWMESATSVSDVTVSNLVLTADLSDGDQLMYYDASEKKYKCWEIKTDSDTGVKYWSSSITVSSSGVNKVGASGEVTIPRGGAVILKRENPGTTGFCIMGKPASSGTVETTLPANAYSLIAPPAVTNTAINSMTWTGIANTDSLIIPSTSGSGFTSLKWNADLNKWRVATDKGWSDDVTIPAGVGAWFINRSNTDKKVTWQ